MKIGGICLNWKVLVGLAAAGVVVWVLAPNAVAGLAPVLLALACPLSMVFMMRGMKGMGQGQPGMQGESQQAPTSPQPVPDIAPAGGALPREAQIAALKADLARLQAQQDKIASEMAALDTANAPAVRQAEAVARAVQRRG